MSFDHPDLQALYHARAAQGSPKTEPRLDEKTLQAVIAADPTVDGSLATRSFTQPDVYYRAPASAPAASGSRLLTTLRRYVHL